METVIYACDVGSTRTDGKRRAGSGFGWACVSSDPEAVDADHGSIEAMADTIGRDLHQGRSVALGFECPLFIPLPRAAAHLCTGRTGEGNRSFAAPAGLAVTTLGLQQATWLLKQLAGYRGSVHFTLDPRDWPPGERQVLFCWEAFVSGKAHSDTHTGDALTAVRAFSQIADLAAVQDVEVHPKNVDPANVELLSLIGMAAVWSGWSTDMADLRRPCVVIKPEARLDQ